MRRSPLRLAILLGLFTSPWALAADTDPTLTKADQLLKQRQPQEAYSLLAPLEDERSGNPDYDYLYGLAALESGKPGVAAFAFERCLAVDPRNGPCRVMMARTHIALGEHKSARYELETVQGSNPPSEVQALVGQYLGVVQKREAGEKRRHGAYVQVGLGYDTNVTGTPDDDQIAIPLFGGALFALNGAASKQEDLFLQAEAGASAELVLNPAWTLVGDASLGARQYDDVDTFDNQSANAGVGMAWREGANSVLTKLQLQDYRLDGDAFRSLYGLLTQYQHALADDEAVSLYLQGSHLDYHFGTPDADRYTLGGGYSRALGARFAPVVYSGLYVGQESSDGPDFLTHDFYGLRLGGSLGLAETLRLTGALSVEQRNFDGQSPVFFTTREDTVSDFSLGALYQVNRHLSLRPTYTYTNSSSNIVLNDYERHVVALDMRYEM